MRTKKITGIVGSKSRHVGTEVGEKCGQMAVRAAKVLRLFEAQAGAEIKVIVDVAIYVAESEDEQLPDWSKLPALNCGPVETWPKA